ncbi:substrate-binding periplasmic protein [Pseudomonas sp. 5P_3.1_Bac2]|uniref:substrate-binding periplasmic protein n=1 Tax=Pseudomonas sp. 5P_3.1_Bac2 TaxID=2971617 RepID=UPI0021C5CA3A|nr:transporter substrate-binding domain-containing protein [Pseudomonas sp. 5P_3.1_Bac2]MCU1718413.1 transporter substrate-binding domain-containing protein [Pseudomonas sp. 5P_3.1_Bac2]
MGELRVALLGLLLLWLAPANAQPELRLVANTWPPFNDETLPGNGVASDLVSTALARAGYLSNYTEVPWARAVRGLQRGTYDILINAWYSDERAAYGDFSAPYLVNRIRFVQRRGSAIGYQQLTDLHAYSIAIVRGYAYSPEFDKDPQLNRVGVLSFEVAARMLHAGRVQLALEDELVARYHLNRNLAEIREDLEFLPKPLSENGLHILISLNVPEHRQIAERFDQAIAAMQADGSYAQIFKRHGL